MRESTVGQVIRNLSVGPFKTVCKVIPSGSLQVRKDRSGATSFYWRYSIGKRSERVRIGIYDSSAPPKSLSPTSRGYSVQAAAAAAQALAHEHRNHLPQGGRPALLAQREQDSKRADAAAMDLDGQSLKALLDLYCDYLETLGRPSHYDARNIFKHHVSAAWPEQASAPARDLSSEAVADMMRRLIDMRKGRTANKLRSYIRSAYQTGKAARTKPSIPEAFKAFQIKSNPAADTSPDESQNKPDKNPLSLPHLQAYWQVIRQIDGFQGACLRLHLLTGGQRIEQFVRLLTEHAQPDQILLFDGKGRPGRPPRPHAVPLVDAAAVALMECQPRGTYALSTDGGHTPLAATTLSRWAAAAGSDIPGFQTKRLRSGVETALAAARVSLEHRGRLQSHGVSGVQSRHYDGHEYMDEKREALERLAGLLESKKEGVDGSSQA